MTSCLPWSLRLLFGYQAGSVAARRMLEVEAAQLAMSAPLLEETVDAADPRSDAISRRNLQRLVGRMKQAAGASQILRDFLEVAHKKMRARGTAPRPTAKHPGRRRPRRR